MNQGHLTGSIRRLLLCLGTRVREDPDTYRNAGQWLDEFYEVEGFWRRRGTELRLLEGRSECQPEDEETRYQLQYLRLMIETKTYLPLDSSLFRLMTLAETEGAKKQRKLPKSEATPDRAKPLAKLTDLLNLSEEQFTQWLYQHIPEFRDSGLSLGAFAYVMEYAILKASAPSRPPIELARKILANWGTFQKEPALRFRFRDAQESLLWKCWGKDFLDIQDAQRVSVVIWLLADPDADKRYLHLTKFESWPWNQGSMGRDHVFYETFMWTREVIQKWIGLAEIAHEVLAIGDTHERREEEPARESGQLVCQPQDETVDLSALGLNDTERNIIEALGTETLTGKEIAERAGYPMNSNFKTTLANLRKRSLLGNKAPGYFLRPEHHHLLRTLKQGQDQRQD